MPPAAEPTPSAAVAAGPRRWPWLFAAVALAWLWFGVYASAWLCDDAYITFRTVENALAGHGLRWNVADRVQTYTHPLWMLLLLGARALVGDMYEAAIGLCFLASGAAIVVLARIGRDAIVAGSLLFALGGSRAFLSFATSGLENPLSYLLLALFAAELLRAEPRAPRLPWLALLGGLLAQNRLDLALLVAPAMVWVVWRHRSAGWIRPCLVGGLPLLLWFAFAFVYYGSLLPITAYAKAMGTGIDPGLLAHEGLRYLLDPLTRDPVTALLLAAGLLLGLLCRRGAPLALAVGAALYLAYVVKIGGDFMAGRFLTGPLVLLVAVLAGVLRHRPRGWSLALAGASAVLAFVPGPPLQLLAPDAAVAIAPNGSSIADERSAYHETLGLRSAHRQPPVCGQITAALRAGGITRTVFDVTGYVGQAGYRGGEQVHFVDPWLCDPLLMRLPMRDPTRWRIGHYTRTVPDGYLETLARGGNAIRHPGLAAFYDKLELVVRGPVFDWRRLLTAAGMCLGRYDHLLADYVREEYRSPPVRRVAAAVLDRAVPEPSWWFTTPCELIGEGGLEVAFPAPQRAARLRAVLDARDLYEIDFLVGGATVASVQVATADVPYLQMQACDVAVPAAAQGFDRLRIRRGAGADGLPWIGRSGDSVYAVASLRVE